MQLLLPLLYSILFILLICKMNFFEVPLISKAMVVLLFIVKLFAGAIVWYIYRHNYTDSDFLDYFRYSSDFIYNIFHTDQRPYSTAWTGSFDNSLFNGAKPMIVLNAFLQIFSFGNFYVHAIFFCFFSFIGLVALLKAFNSHFPDKKRVVFTLFFVPTILFWGSSALKESLVIGLVGLLVYISDFGLRKKYSGGRLIAMIVMLLFLLLIKMYVLFALMPVLLVNVIVSRTSANYFLVKYILVLGTCIIFFFLAALFKSDYNIVKIISDKQAKAISEAKGGIFLADTKNFICIDYNKKDVLIPQARGIYKIKNGSTYLLWKQDNMSDTTFIANSKDTASYRILYKIAPARSVMAMKRLKPTIAGFILYAPVAFINALLHPLFPEIHSWMHVIIAIENVCILLLIILSIFLFDKAVLQKKEIIFFCLVFAVVLFVLIGMTTPAIGAMVRYRTIALLFLVTGCALMVDREKLRKIKHVGR